MDSETLKAALASIDAKLEAHSEASEKRDKLMVDKINEVAVLARKANDKADLAHSVALTAKQAASRASIDAEGADHNIFAELGSLKVVMSEHTQTLKAASVKLEEAEQERERQKKMDAKARRFWRVAQPTIIAAVLAALNQIVNLGPIPKLQPNQAQAAPEMKDAGR